jgi:hypothetical protein
MKKVLAFLAAVTMISGSAFADASVYLNTYDAGHPIFYLTSGSPATGSDFFAEVLGGPQGGALAPIASSGVSTFAIVAGDFDNGFGSIPGLADNSAGSFTLRAWKGTAGYDAALEKGSVSWNQTTGANPGAPALPTPATLNIPSSVLIVAAVPEPSTIALGLLGAAALLIRRRK